MKILFIPAAEERETSERLPELIHILQKRHNLLFLKPEEHWTQIRVPLLLRAWERLQVTRQLIREGKNLQGVDLVFCTCGPQYAYIGLKIARHLRVPCLWDSHGSSKAFWEDSHRYASGVLPWIPLEKWLARRVDFLIAITDRDRQAYLQQGVDPNRISTIPHSIRLERASQKSRREARLALQLPEEEMLFFFFAMFNYPPNRAALHFLNEEVAPRLPGRLLLTGKGELPRPLHPHIRYLGFVPLQQLYDLIRACDICLSPVREVKGLLTKILEMLAHGAPTVISRAAQRGIPEIEDGVHALVAESEDDFIQKTLLLARDRGLRDRLSHAAPEIVQKKYNWQLHEGTLLQIVESFSRKT